MANAGRNNLTVHDVKALLPKFADLDSDIRFMSLVDLCNALNSGPPTLLLNDYDTCARIIDALLKTLDDTNGDVQSQALKSIGPLAGKAPPEILCPFVEKLTTLETTKSLDSSIPATATRTLVSAFPRPLSGIPPTKATQEAYSAITKVLIPRLLGYIVIPHGIKGLPDPPRGMLETDSEKGASSDALDLLVEVVRCFGPMLQDAEKQALLKRLIDILDDRHTGNVTKKKAVAATSILAVYLSDMQLSKFVLNTIESFHSPHLLPAKRRLLISMIGSVARSIPQRLGQHLKTLAPFILSPLSEQELTEAVADIDEEGALDPAVEEVKEAALVTLDDCLASCGNEMRMYTNEAIESSLRYVEYDPTLAMSDDEDMSGTQTDDNLIEDEDDFELEDEDFEEEAALSDGDDASWKIRRCAAKVLHTIIATRGSGDLLENGTLYDQVAPTLIKCFKEREENVLLEIMATLSALIKKTGEGMPTAGPALDDEGYVSGSQTFNSRKRRRGGSDADMASMPSGGTMSPADSASPSPISGPRGDLARLGRSIVPGVAKLLKNNSVSTKQAAITLLRDFITVQHGGLTEYLTEIVVPLMDAITSTGIATGSHTAVSVGGTASATGSSLRIEALQLLRAICDTHSSRILTPYVDKMVPGLVLTVNDKYFKISGEAVGVTESVTRTLTRCDSREQIKKYIGDVFDVVMGKARTHDTDLEVRRRAIGALGTLLARTASANSTKTLPTVKRSDALNVLYERLKNETTRLASIQAIETVAASSMNKEEIQTEWVRTVALELASQLRKSDRLLRGSSLKALKRLIANPTALSCLDDKTVRGLVDLLLPLIDCSSLGLLALAMGVLADLVKQSPKHIINEELTNALCNVAATPLGGNVLDALLSLIGAIGSQNIGQPLMQGLLRNVGVLGDPAIVGSAIGTLLVSGGPAVGVSISDIVNELRSAQDDQPKCLALAILGEASYRLGTASPLRPGDFLEYFTTKSDSVPRAAAIALGRAGSGNASVYLPVILSQMNQAGSTQLLLLHSIKEILQRASKARTDISRYTEEIWKQLLTTSEVEDNKAVGAECIGRLISIEPKKYLPLLQNYLHDPTPSVRGMVIQAVRFAFIDADEAFDEVLKPIVIHMLTTMLNDSTLENRRLALITLNSATQNKPSLILPHLSKLLPLVVKESIINPALVREVQMGPFKHKVDDGLEIRKSAYETLNALMSTAFSRMSVLDLFDRVIAGLQDEHDIKMLCNLMLTKLIVLDPNETTRRADSIAERYQAILTVKLKENAVKQELEKAQESTAEIMRVTVRLQNALQLASSSGGYAQAQAWRGYWDWVGKEHKAQLQAAELSIKQQR